MDAALRFVLGQPWAMLPEMVDTLISIADRANDAPEAVAARLGKPLDNTRIVQVRDNVAVVPINGPISRYASMFDDISGATSVEVLARDFRTALDDPEVKGIVLEIDSPGGQAAGIGELASMIRAGSGQKPVTAYVSSMGASAALWLASAASRVVVAPSALMGSMGVVWPVSVPRKDDKGPKTIEFVSSQSPNKRPDPETDAGRAQMQAVVDEMAAVFVASVAEYRGLDAKTAVDRFNKGGLLIGRKAVDAGMADAIGSLESCIADLNKSSLAASLGGHRGPFSKGIEPMKFNFAKLFTGWMSKGCPESIDTAEIAAIAGSDDETVENQESEDVASTNLGEMTVGLKADTASLEAEIAKAREAMRAEMAAELRAGRIELYKSQADVFLSLHSGKILPAESAALKSAFVASALLDIESPIEGFKALDGFKASIEARAPHKATAEVFRGDAAEVAEHLSSNGLKTLGNGYSDESDADAEIDALLSATEEGRVSLAARKAK